MNTKIRSLLAIAAIGCFSLFCTSCDKEDDAPSMADLNIAKLESFHASRIDIIYEEIGFGHGNTVASYRIESPYLVVKSSYGYIYYLDMNNVVAFRYTEADNSLEIWF